MALWVLRRTTEQPVYDVNNGFVIRAHTSFRARLIASEHAGDEGPEVWRDASKSTCVTLPSVGGEIVVMADFNAG